MTQPLPPWAAALRTRLAALPALAGGLGRRARRLPWWGWAVATAAVVALAVALWMGPREWLVLAGAVGRFHPGFVHLPIGALVVAAVLVALARTGRLAAARTAVLPVLVVAAAGAVAAVAAGQALAADGNYSGDTFDWHRILGYALAVVTAAAAGTAWYALRTGRATFRLLSDVAVGLGVALIGITGHLGGTLTHGEGYLTERLPAPLNAWFGHVTAQTAGRRVQPAEVPVYGSLVAPILSEHCVDCHGPSKANGELRLDTPEHITAGGRTGAALVAGQAAASDMIHRLWLPPSHADVMPPKGRPAMPVVDASVLRWWVDQGASFDQTLADVELVAEVTPAIQARIGELALDGPPLLAVDPGPLDQAALAALMAQRLPVSRLADGVDWLQVEARGRGRTFGDAELAALLPVASHVTWVDLGGTAVTDAAGETLAKFPHLMRLDLDRTTFTDEGLAGLAALPHLQALNLYGTRVTDAGVTHLEALASLRTLYLDGTAVTADGVRAAATARPDLVVHASVTTGTPPSPPAAGRATRPTPAR